MALYKKLYHYFIKVSYSYCTDSSEPKCMFRAEVIVQCGLTLNTSGAVL